MNRSVYDSQFFKLLNSTYVRAYLEAQRELWTIVLPADGSYSMRSVDASFVGNHILKPSPHFLDHFISCGSTYASPALIEYDEDRAVLHTSGGFPFKKHVHVLADEFAYNEYLQPFRILLVDEPLHCEPKKICRSNCRLNTPSMMSQSPKRSTPWLKDFTKLPEEPPSFQESRAHLESCFSSAALRVVNEKVENFVKNYIILEKFINDTVEKLKCISETAVEMLAPRTDDIKQVTHCVENYISGLAHHKVFACSKRFCRFLDANLERRLEYLRLSEVSAAMLGISDEAFQCDLPMSIVELASLDSKYTPLDKLWCLRRTINSIQTEIMRHVESLGLILLNEIPALTTDVLINLIVIVMARSKSPNLAANIYYIDHFCGVKDDFSSFTVSTFKAAIEVARDFSIVKVEHLSPSSLKKEISLTDFMEMTASMNEDLQLKSDDCDTSGEEKSVLRNNPVDSKLEEITRLIEKQTLDFHSKEEEQLRKQEAFSSLPSSTRSVTPSTDEGLFSPLSSLRRSLRGSFKP